MTSRVAVVTVAHGRHEHLRRQVRSLATGTGAHDHVVVSMSDPVLDAWADDDDLPHVVTLDADPAALPLSRARNIGAQRGWPLPMDWEAFDNDFDRPTNIQRSA